VSLDRTQVRNAAALSDTPCEDLDSAGLEAAARAATGRGAISLRRRSFPSGITHPPVVPQSGDGLQTGDAKPKTAGVQPARPLQARARLA
jgi:hypothetical protein